MKFRLAGSQDIEAIIKLMLSQKQDVAYDRMKEITERELTYNKTDKFYRLFVVELEGAVLGFSRFFHTKEIPEEKKEFECPEGFYCMGTVVFPEYRKRGVARMLSEGRFLAMKELGAKEAFSGVGADNEASIKMHESFGYQKVAEIAGFLQIQFNCGKGYLFKKEL